MRQSRRRRKSKRPAVVRQKGKPSIPNRSNPSTDNNNGEGPSNSAKHSRRPPDDTEDPVPFYERPLMKRNLPRRTRFPGRYKKVDSDYDIRASPRDRTWQENASVLNDPTPSPQRDRIAPLSLSGNPFLRDKQWVIDALENARSNPSQTKQQWMDDAFEEPMFNPFLPPPPLGHMKDIRRSLSRNPSFENQKGANDGHRKNITTVESSKTAGLTASVAWRQAMPRLTTPDNTLLPAWSTAKYDVGSGQVSELTQIFSAENYRDILGESFTSVYRAGPPPRQEMHVEEFSPITWL